MNNPNIQPVRVLALRRIVTEISIIQKGEVGLVPRAWIDKAIAGNCSCKGSANWFRVIND